MFLFDRQTRTLERISIANDGTEGNGRNLSPSLSADGRFVAFASEASNLMPGDTNGVLDVLLFARQEGTLAYVTGGGESEAGSLVLRNATVADNSTTYGSAAIQGRIVIHNSLFARNEAFAATFAHADVGLDVHSLGHNLLERGGPAVLAPSDRIDPSVGVLLGPLQDRGGPTWTHELPSARTNSRPQPSSHGCMSG